MVIFNGIVITLYIVIAILEILSQLRNSKTTASVIGTLLSGTLSAYLSYLMLTGAGFIGN